jgi:inorganic pyrophosphatase
MDFWTRLDELISTHEIVIDRPKGSRHPKHPEILYLFDYGYLKGTSGGDGNEVDVCRGTLGEGRLVGVMCTVDSMKGDAELKLLYDCTEDEILLMERFFNTSDCFSGMIVRRNKQASNENT